MIDFIEIEKNILKFWRENKIFKKLEKKNQGKKRWSFLDGPITANNPMGVHHAWGRTYKDLFQRYKAMRGLDQRYQNGFDCQGLWVEVEVEKELGFKTKKDIEKYGIGEFVEKCKERVWKYSKIQTEQSIRLGQWMDWQNSYYTMSDENNYAIWHFLKKCWQDGLLYKGRDVVPWCIRCGTAISQHEILTEEYKEISHKSIFFKLPIFGRDRTYFLAWTTTPWTLPANVALAVNPELEYAEIQDGNSQIFIVLKEKSFLVSGGKVIKTFLGAELEGIKYKGLFDELPEVKKSLGDFQHQVILWEDVSIEEGTGIVHIAPGCGQEDFQLGKKFKLPVINPTDEESKYKEGFGGLSGKLVTEVNDIIFENLSGKGLVYKIEDYLHRYPTCWRCKTELIFRLVDEWYISMGKLRDPLAAIARKITWIPSFGLDREIDWLKNMQDWLISKKRYWGLALPIFECSCGNFDVIGSKEELGKRAVEGWEGFKEHSPHRPWVDKIKIKCSRCGEAVSRIVDVGSPWLDAGIVPFSTMRYFEDKKYWEKWFPPDFICESFPGQFKNWFYSLIVMSAVLEKSVPSKTIFGYASVRDEKGEEMHKSKGNAIWFDEAVEKIGADIMRWMYARQNPAANLPFGYNVAKEAQKKILNLWNSHVFFQTYGKKPESAARQPRSKNFLDRWIISRLNSLISQVTDRLDQYDAAAASESIEQFFTEDLSLWYIRRSRRRFHWSENKEGKREANTVLYRVLLDLIKLLSPILPFFGEEMYQNLKIKDMPESIHLCDWPKARKMLIDLELEEKMAKVREIVAQALAERAKAGIKVRQPLLSLQFPISNFQFPKELLDLIKEEINVKEIAFGANLKLDTEITPELKEEGIIREVIRQIQEMRKEAGLKPEDKISVEYSGTAELSRILEENKEAILAEIKAKDFKSGAGEKEITIDQQKLSLAIKKLQ